MGILTRDAARALPPTRQLAAVMGARGVTRKALAEAVGTSESSLSRILAGRQRSPDVLARVAAWAAPDAALTAEGLESAIRGSGS